MGPQGGGDLVISMLGCVCLKVKEMGPFLAKIMRNRPPRTSTNESPS